jgi:hypothetical protein
MDEPQAKKLAFTRQAGQRISADKFSLIVFVFCILAVLGQIALILVSLGKLPPQIPLFYIRPWGDAMLAPLNALWFLPAIALVTFILNFIFAFFAVREYFFLLRILVVFALIVSLATLYDVFKIVALLI